MPGAFHILGSARPRPASRATVFCDGSADDTFRPARDVELSHWIPNRTPSEFRADTSTEMCLRFVASGTHESYDLVVNNHLDVDGVLSVFTVVEPRLALQHREALVGAAEIGDFWAYGSGVALSIFATLTDVLQQPGEEDDGARYERCFAIVRNLLGGAEPPAVVDDARSVLAASLDLVESGRIARSAAHERFVAYVVPRDLAAPDLAAALHVPEFNAPLTRATLLLPHARNFRDKERVQLVSVDTGSGWCHDLWYPGYTWADTQNLWRAPGSGTADGAGDWPDGFAALAAAVGTLHANETAAGAWTVASRLQPFESIPGRKFPVVLSFVGTDGGPAPSALPPAAVRDALAPAFA